MWVFGYGSLMWDGWEKDRGCLRRTTAELKGYARAFNKLSVLNWGSNTDPGPTLNLVAGAGSCRGAAFEFDQANRAGIVAYLDKREGKGFALKELLVAIDGDETVKALVSLYQGRNILPPTSVTVIAAMAMRAKGTSGTCADYIESIADQLRKLGIDDPAVATLHEALVEARSPKTL